MLKVNTGDQRVDVNWHRLPYGTGEGPTVFNIPGGAPPPPPIVTKGILQESSLVYFIMMENGTDYILQE